MNLSRTERWILANQYRILERLDTENAQAHSHAAEALECGYELYYDWIAEHVVKDKDILAEEESKHVLEVMTMYEALQVAFDATTDKDGINKYLIEFPGFDGNHEGKLLGFARYFREEREAFETLRCSGDSLNSHHPTDSLYSQMLRSWGQSTDKRRLTKDDLIRITNSVKGMAASAE